MLVRTIMLIVLLGSAVLSFTHLRALDQHLAWLDEHVKSLEDNNVNVWARVDKADMNQVVATQSVFTLACITGNVGLLSDAGKADCSKLIASLQSQQPQAPVAPTPVP